MLKKVLVGAVLLGVIIGAYLINKIFTSNTKFDTAETYVYIPTGANYDTVKKLIEPLVDNMDKVNWVAEKRSYTDNVKAGKFLLTKGMSSFSIVQALRKNIPVKLSFNNQEKTADLFKRISSQLEINEGQLNATFNNDNFLKENNLTQETLLSFFIPNSYEFYWNIPAEELAKRLKKEYQRFWNEERLEKAKKLNLSPAEVYTVASIVHKETAKNDERPRVAGVYLNRLNQKMPLQADPTVIYAQKLAQNNWDLVIKRVVNTDTRLNSPYNTYKVAGLPPGPIFMPDVSAIDAVLNAEKHNYIFFCASVTKFGYHEFAENYADHQVIAAKYSEWVTKQNYKR